MYEEEEDGGRSMMTSRRGYGGSVGGGCGVVQVKWTDKTACSCQDGSDDVECDCATQRVVGCGVESLLT